MAMERDRVRKLHQDLNAALTEVAKKHGFVYNAGSLSYTDLHVSGRVKFVLSGKEIEYANRTTIASSPQLGLAVGDLIVIGSNPEQYKITGFSNRGSINVSRVRDNKAFRVPSRSAALVRRVDFKGVEAEATKTNVIVRRPQEAIMSQIVDVYGALSPENLTCDGELPQREVRRRAAQLNRELERCFTELGRQVEETEAWDWYEKNKKAYEANRPNAFKGV